MTLTNRGRNALRLSEAASFVIGHERNEPGLGSANAWIAWRRATEVRTQQGTLARPPDAAYDQLARGAFGEIVIKVS